MFNKVYFDISGSCNAKCPWCTTGSRFRTPRGSFIDPATFEKAIQRLLDLGFLGPRIPLGLYNWGEPLLNPRFGDIMEITHRHNLPVILSTNASTVPAIENISLSNVINLILSMPGWSQSSYDRIHGFRFDRILKNIDRISELFHAHGFKGKVFMSFHVYQFNIPEIYPALEFCRERDIIFTPFAAFLADYDYGVSYLDGSMPNEILRKAGKELFLHYVDGLIADRPKDYRCPQWDILTLDENCDVLTCCAVGKGHVDYALGSLFEFSGEVIEEGKLHRNVCNQCMSLGYAYWVHHPLTQGFIKYLVDCQS